MAKRLQVEVTIISAQNLKSMKIGCFSGNMSPFAVAWTSSNPARKATAPLAKGQGQHPTWNFKQTFFCDEDSITKGLESLTVELWYSSFLKKTRLLGTVTVPLSSEYLSDAPKPVSSDVLLSSGKKQGVLKCSVKISESPVPAPVPAPVRKLGPDPKPHVPPKSTSSSTRSVGGRRGTYGYGGGGAGSAGGGGGGCGCGGGGAGGGGGC